MLRANFDERYRRSIPTWFYEFRFMKPDLHCWQHCGLYIGMLRVLPVNGIVNDNKYMHVEKAACFFSFCEHKEMVTLWIRTGSAIAYLLYTLLYDTALNCTRTRIHFCWREFTTCDTSANSRHCAIYPRNTSWAVAFPSPSSRKAEIVLIQFCKYWKIAFRN